MTATTDQVRAIIADQPNYHRAAATGDGVTVEFSLPFRPVTADSETVYLDGTATPTGWTLADNTGIITFTAAPADGTVIAVTYTHTLLSDTDLATYLDLTDSDPRLAAAMALDTIATNEALVSKRIKLLEITTDGPAVAKSLREHAATLRTAADADDEFDIIELAGDTFSQREMIWNRALRGDL